MHIFSIMWYSYRVLLTSIICSMASSYARALTHIVIFIFILKFGSTNNVFPRDTIKPHVKRPLGVPTFLKIPFVSFFQSCEINWGTESTPPILFPQCLQIWRNDWCTVSIWCMRLNMQKCVTSVLSVQYTICSTNRKKSCLQ